jgi:cytochrome P450
VRNPTVHQKLKAEILEASQLGELSTPHIRCSEAMKLKYLDACCKEGMRLHPSVGLTLPRVVPPGGRMISGQFLAGGTRVGINAAVIYRDQEVFGSDADEFNPDRWLRDGADKMDRYMFQVRAAN